MRTVLSLAALAPAIADMERLCALTRERTFVGIDFGTSTTVVSYVVAADDDPPLRTQVIPFPQDLPDGRVLTSHLLPTAIAWHEDRLFIGAGAHQLKARLVPGRNVWTSFKMDLGVDLGPRFFNSELPDGHPVATILTPKDAAVVFFRFVKREVLAFVTEQGLPPMVAWSVSIPASFESNQRRDLLEALQTAGIELTTHALIDEPNAAFISYLAESSRNTLGTFQVEKTAPLHVLVFDFGAGTCDISILEIGQTDTELCSRNLAISRFQALGGDDIDRHLVSEVLLPQVLQQNGLSPDDFTLADLNKRIIPQLAGPAEQLKIAACKRVAAQMVGQRLPPLARSGDCVTLPGALKILSARRVLSAEQISLRFDALQGALRPFLRGTRETIDSTARLPSIFEPIESALSKAGLTPEHLDLVLLIGGSAANPYVQVALREYFERVDIEVPEDLRAHVSTGAALHSFLSNGLGATLIRPITSEPVVVVMREGVLHTVLPAGTSIPCDPVSVTGFTVPRRGQPAVQIPICLTNERKLLGVLEVRADRPGGFALNTPVTLHCELTEDKVLVLSASVGDHLAVSAVTNPFANRELSTDERKVLEAERSANVSAAQNGGRPTVESLIALSRACQQAGLYLRAAETLESAFRLDGKIDVETSLAYLYARADRPKAAAEWSRKAYSRDRNAVTAFNLALAERREGRVDDYERLLGEAIEHDPDAAFVLVALGRLVLERDAEAGQRLLRKAVSLFEGEMRTGGLELDDYPRLISAAEALGDHSLAEMARRRLEDVRRDKYYRHDSLVGRADTLSMPKGADAHGLDGA